MEKPAQQEQWQKGEQASASSWSCWSVVLVISVFALVFFMPAPASAQGITLSDKTRKAIMKATNFMSCKGKNYLANKMTSYSLALSYLPVISNSRCSSVIRFLTNCAPSSGHFAG